jgi:hypothetical protein
LGTALPAGSQVGPYREDGTSRTDDRKCLIVDIFRCLLLDISQKMFPILETNVYI